MSLTNLFNTHANPHSTPEQRRVANRNFQIEQEAISIRIGNNAFRPIFNQGQLNHSTGNKYVLKIDRLDGETQNQHRNRTRKLAHELVGASRNEIKLHSNPHGGDFTGGRILISDVQNGSLSENILRSYSLSYRQPSIQTYDL